MLQEVKASMSRRLLVLFTTAFVITPAVLAETAPPMLLVLNKEGSLALADLGSGRVRPQVFQKS
jgi:hypothetical protein